MNDEPLIDRIKKQMENKVNPEKIKFELLASGWLEEKIDEIFLFLGVKLPSPAKSSKFKIQITKPFSKKLLFGLIIFLTVGSVFLIFIFKFINKEKSDTKEAKADKKLSYIYDDISQLIGNLEIAKQMTEGMVILDNTKQEVKGVARGIMMGGNYTYEGLLTDVAGSTSTGLAKADWQNNEYNFYSSFAGLKELINGDYYEGWLVRKEPFGFVSTGKLEKVGGEYANFYKSNMDLREYNLYVVTMEENDNTPAPAKHILEGVLAQYRSGTGLKK